MAATSSLTLPFSSRDFRILWFGMAISLVGDGILFVALAWQVLALSNSPTALALVGIAIAIPQASLALVGGVVSDRFERRRVMIVADTIRAIALTFVAALSMTGMLRVWHLVVIGALYGTGSAFFLPAFDAIVPDLVPAEHLVPANAIDQLIRPVGARLVGPMLGGLLVAAVHAGGAFALDALSFAASIACLRRLNAPSGSGNGRSPTSVSPIVSLRECGRFVRRRVWLWGTVASSAVACFLFLGPSEVLLPFLVKHDLGASPATLGAIIAFGGVGTVIAAILVGRRGLPRRSVTFMYTAWTMSTLAIAAYGLASAAWQLMAACCVFNAFEGAGLISWASLRQRFVPGDLLGRVSSLDWAVAAGLLPVSLALVGPAAAAFGARQTLFVAGLLASAVTAGAYFLPGMREFERDPSTAEIPSEFQASGGS